MSKAMVPEDTQPEDPVALCQALVRCPSVTPDDAGCQPLIQERLQRLGFQLETMRSGDVDNLWARRGNTQPLVVFAGHTDVVPTGEESMWSSPPFAADIIDEHIVGRGAADMKGSVAAATIAIERFVAMHGDDAHGSIAMLLTSDEEGPAIDGTRHVMETLQARGENIDHAVVIEPTSTNLLGDVIKNGRRGSLGATLTVNGIQGHVAYPHLADNPVHRLAPMLTELVAIEWDKGDDYFPPTTLQISNVQAGTGATNVIPGNATVVFNLRFGTATDVATIKRRVTELVERHELDATIDWRLSAEPFITPKGELTQAISDAIFTVTGVETHLETGGGTSDGRFIAPTGAQVVEVGPINATIHQIDERVSCADLRTLTQIYTTLLERLLVQKA